MTLEMQSFGNLIIILLGSLISSAYAQNCAIPTNVVLASRQGTRECEEPGTFLINVTGINLQCIESVSSQPDNFANVFLETSESDQIQSLAVIVGHSICPCFTSNASEIGGYGSHCVESKTPIDETWDDDLDVIVNLRCKDGRDKTVRIKIPVRDENTAAPFFRNSIYELQAEPCYLGIHKGMCPLNFETLIVVYDADRDVQNARVNCHTDMPDLVTCIPSELKLDFKKKNARKLDQIILGRHHVWNLQLYIKEGRSFKPGDSLSFQLTVYNDAAKSPSGTILRSIVPVRVIFTDKEFNPSLPVILEPPKFTSEVYYATITKMAQITPGKEIPNLRPTDVDAILRSGSRLNELGDLIANNVSVKYFLSESNLLRIDSETGKLYFKDCLILTDYLREPTELIHEITAQVKDIREVESRVPLLVILDLDYETISTLNPEECPGCPEKCLGPTTPDIGSTTTPVTSPSTERTTKFTTDIPTTFATNPTSTGTDFTSSVTPTSVTSPNTGWPIWPSPSTTHQTLPTSTQTTPSSPHPNASTTASPRPPTTESPIVTNKPLPTLPTSSSPTTTDTPSVTSDMPPNPTTTSRPTNRPTIPPITTEIISGSTTPDPELSSTTPEDDFDDGDSCCEPCQLLWDFECPIILPDPTLYFPDPHECNKYYQCHFAEDPNPYTFQCVRGYVFCPAAQSCVIPGRCSCPELPSNCTEEARQKCRPCREPCLLGSDPQNICTQAGRIPDPRFYNAFHDCSPDGDPTTEKYIDCMSLCAHAGNDYLVYCPEDRLCAWKRECEHAAVGKIHHGCRNRCSSFYRSRGVLFHHRI